MDTLRSISNSEKRFFDLDRILAERVVSHLLELNSICSDRMGAFHTRIHPLK